MKEISLSIVYRAFCIGYCCLLAGCASNRFRGVLEQKDTRFRNVKFTLATPWGTQTLEIGEIDTRLNPEGNNPLPPLAVPQPAVVTEPNGSTHTTTVSPDGTVTVR